MTVRRTRIVEIRDVDRDSAYPYPDDLLDACGVQASWEHRAGAGPATFDTVLTDEEAGLLVSDKIVLVDREIKAEIVDHLPKPWLGRGHLGGPPSDEDVYETLRAAREALVYAAEKGNEASLVYGEGPDAFWSEGGDGPAAIERVNATLEQLEQHTTTVETPEDKPRCQEGKPVQSRVK